MNVPTASVMMLLNGLLIAGPVQKKAPLKKAGQP